MREDHRGNTESKEFFLAELEKYAREKIWGHLQDLLAEEVTGWLGRWRCRGSATRRSLSESVMRRIPCAEAFLGRYRTRRSVGRTQPDEALVAEIAAGRAWTTSTNWSGCAIFKRSGTYGTTFSGLRWVSPFSSMRKADIETNGFSAPKMRP